MINMNEKKITYIVLTAILVVIAFFIGMNFPTPDVDVSYPVEKTSLNLENENDFIKACNLMGDIVDWNTDGTEIAVMTKDGYEFYAYKSEDIYGEEK